MERSPTVGLVERQRTSLLRSGWNSGTGVYERSPVSASEAIKAAKCSATVEGLICGSVSFFLHLARRKRLKHFNPKDWQEVSRDTLVGVGRGAYRGVAIFLISSYTTLSVPLAGLVASVAMSIAEAAAEYSEGLVPGSVCVGRMIVGCLASAVYSVFAKVGELIIPLPYVGPILGGAIGIGVCRLLRESVTKMLEQQLENR